jgi:hypothetical protein
MNTYTGPFLIRCAPFLGSSPTYEQLPQTKDAPYGAVEIRNSENVSNRAVLLRGDLSRDQLDAIRDALNKAYKRGFYDGVRSLRDAHVWMNGRAQ